MLFCGCNHLSSDPKFFILMIAIKLLMRMENKICGSLLILLKIMVIFPLTSEGSEILAFLFFAVSRKKYVLQMRCVILSSVRNSAFGTAAMRAACAVAVLFLGFCGFFHFVCWSSVCSQ